MLGVGSFETITGPPVKSVIDLDKWRAEEDYLSEESSSEDLNTASYQCLLVPKISRSSIFREPFFHFPDIEEPYLESALWGIDPKLQYDSSGIAVYTKICREEGIMPLRRVLSFLTKTTLDLRFFGLQEKEMKSICSALVSNNYVSVLLLEENHLSPKSVEYLLPVIKQNNTLSCLNLRHCNIGYFGAQVLGDCFKSNVDLIEIDLSFNNLNNGLEFLVDGFKLNKNLKKLNLSHNNLGDDAMVAFRSVLEDNYNLVSLDLSWNNIYKPVGMKELMEGLAENVSIEEVNLAWNGIGENNAVKRLMMFLKTEETKLKHLDLSNNRITGEIPIKMLIAGLKVNESLLTLRLGGNPLMPAEVETITTIARQTNLKKLDFGDTWIKKSFLPIRNRTRRKGCQVTHGSIYSNYKILGPDIKEMLLKRAKFVAMKQKKKKLRKDYGHWLLTLKDDIVTAEEFETMTKAAKIKLDRDLQEMIGKTFGKGESRKMSIIEVRDLYMKLFPDTKLPEKKAKGKKKKKPTA